ncbi:MAG TPA: EamA family transporter [Blastocatellia bacterium]|nr:EamA family transporter [Blastocatellia bacterium]
MTQTGKQSDAPDQSQRGVLSGMSFAVIALAFSSVFITKLERQSVPPLVIAFYRMAIATVLLAPFAALLKWREIRALARRDLALLLLGGFSLAIHFGAWITSLKYIPISTSVVLVNSHPLFVVLASHLFLRERPTRVHLSGTALGLAGMLVIGRDGLTGVESHLAGQALAILGALAVVGYFIIGRKVRARVSLLGYVTPLYGVCALFLFVWALIAGNPLYPYQPSVWGYFLALAIVPTILGHTVFNWAIKHVRPAAISLAFLGEPVVASLLGFIIFGQRPSHATYIGGALILAGIYLTTSFKPPPAPPQQIE